MLHLPRLLKWLDRGALINVDTPGCGTSVVRGLKGHNQDGFYSGVELYPKVSSPKVPTCTSCRE